MVGWKFWQRGDDELGLPGLSTGTNAGSTGLDFAQHYEPPAAEPFGANAPGLPPLGTPSAYTPGQNPSPFAPTAFSQQPQAPPPMEEPTSHPSKELELITAKLDAIRAQLETMNMRLTVIEQRLPPSPDAPNPRRPWY